MKIKICGIRRKEDVQYVNDAEPDLAGFVFADSKRQISVEQARKLKRLLKPGIKTVGVFVNAPMETPLQLAKDGVIDMIQLHGDETEDYICRLKALTDTPIIKAVRVKDEESILKADELSCQFLLLDAYSKDQYGGTGTCFAWEMIPETLKHSYLLAGGLSEENIPEALQFAAATKRCIGLDVSGGVETGGVKDNKKIAHIVAMVHEL